MNEFKLLNELEERIDTSGIAVEGLWVYPLIKHVLHLYFSPNKEIIALPEKPVKYVAESIKWGLKNSAPGSNDIIAFVSNNSRKQGEQPFLIYTDFLYDILPGKEILTFEMPSTNSPKHSVNNYSKKIYYPDLDNIKVILNAKLFAKKDKLDESNLKDIIAFLKLDKSITDVINDKVTKFFAYRNYFKTFLNKTKPKAVVVICSYFYPHTALISICREMEIPVIELQHGHIGLNHPGYIFKQVHGNELFPDYFFSFGDYFTDLLLKESKAFLPEQVISAGFPNIEKTKLADTETSVKKMLGPDETKKVYITSQWANREEIRDFAIELSKIITGEYKIIFKTHPKEVVDKEFYKDLINNNKLIFITDKNINSLEIMKEAFVHSTVWSTSFYEATYFGLPNIFIFADKFTGMIEQFIDNQTNFLAATPEEYLNILNNISDNYNNVSDAITKRRHYYFKENAAENIKDRLLTIIKRSSN